jgi:hypothetical protein
VHDRPAARAPGREQRGDRRDRACSSVTSLPSEAPKPPGSTKSRCMSMTTSAVWPGANGYANGVAGDVDRMRALMRPRGIGRASAAACACVP